MAFHRNKTGDFRVQVFMSVISEKEMSTFYGNKTYLTQRHVRYLCIQIA